MNSIPALIRALNEVTWAKLAAAVGVPYDRVSDWQRAKYQPKPVERAALVKAIRKHAKRLLALAERVEREGKEHNGGK